MSRTPRVQVMATTIACASLMLVATIQAQTPSPSSPPREDGHAHGKVDPKINAPFRKADVKSFVKRFEADDREVYVKRAEIARAVGLKPGMSVADIGAGTGLYTKIFADQVGPGGKVYAVDISPEFLAHIAAQARTRNQPQVATIRGTQDSTNLPSGSIDVAFLCDVYHHLEDHASILASIHRALKPGGHLVLVEFDRVAGKSKRFVLEHIRASQADFRREIEAAGFEPAELPSRVELRENFIAGFRKRATPSKSVPKRASR